MLVSILRTVKRGKLVKALVQRLRPLMINDYENAVVWFAVALATLMVFLVAVVVAKGEPFIYADYNVAGNAFRTFVVLAATVYAYINILADPGARSRARYAYVSLLGFVLSVPVIATIFVRGQLYAAELAIAVTLWVMICVPLIWFRIVPAAEDAEALRRLLRRRS